MKKENQLLIKQKIDQEIVKTTASINEYKKLNIPMALDNSVGRVSRMDAINNRGVLNVALKRAESRLEKLKIVKKEINKKDFGICINCNKDIPIGRLILVPESKQCVHCA
tara:strand:+ start:292 stop:621 length:330 start_codon:yes stop_codon:yes gene_type:complete